MTTYREAAGIWDWDHHAEGSVHEDHRHLIYHHRRCKDLRKETKVWSQCYESVTTLIRER